MKEIRRNPRFKKNISRRFSIERSVTIGLKLKILVSDVLVIIGSSFLLTGIPFALAFIPFASILAPNFSDTDPVIEGNVITVNATSAIINETQVYEYTFAYNPPDGGSYEGTGYSTGQIFKVNDPIQVIYKRNQQEISKAQKLRLSSFPSGIGFIVLIFPLIGVIMLYFGVKKAVNAFWVLKVGEVAYGKLLHKEPTNTTVNKQRVYKLTFEFTAKDNRTYQTIAKTHLTYRLEDEEQEKLVYDPDDPENAVLLDALPIAVRNFFENEG